METRSRQLLKVAIEANIPHAESGGVGQALLSLVHGLGQLRNEAESYTIIVRSESQKERLKSHLGSGQEFVVKPKASKPSKLIGRLQRSLSRRLLGPPKQHLQVPVSDGFYESLGCDVIHFFNQESFTLCAMPAIYNPHDLQHLHYPEFFTPSVIAKREVIYRAGCQYGNTVVVGSQWIKDDVINQYGTKAEKIQVIPEHPPTQVVDKPSTERLGEVRDKYQLHEPFIIYPAVAWEHKNHIRLFEALATLRDRHGIKVRLVCTGGNCDFLPRVQQRMNELQLSSQVRFLGFVSEEDLRAIYMMSEFLIMPTLFEASSLPIFEAWLEGTPVACSNITALPDQVLDAALLFDPNDVESIADAIVRMTDDVGLRQHLKARGYDRLQDFDPERTAKAYRAVYRRAARHHLTEEDRYVLDWDWMLNPQRELVINRR